MSGDEHFLARWSRRKREAAAEARDRPASPPPPAAEAAAPAQPTKTEPAPLAALPPLDAIDSASDIGAFLAPGVPIELTRAALRRAWTADPAIRDFIGLSENAWDFTAPDGVPGFGSLDLDQARKLVEDLFAPPRASEPAVLPAAAANDPPPLLPDRSVVSRTPAAADAPPCVTAAEERRVQASAEEPRSRRQHGGALPQ